MASLRGDSKGNDTTLVSKLRWGLTGVEVVR